MSEPVIQSYLLETSAAIKMIRAGVVAAPGVCISIITFAELNNGAAKYGTHNSNKTESSDASDWLLSSNLARTPH